MHLLLLMVLSYMSLNLVDAVRWSDEICSGDNMMITFSKCCGNEPYCSSNTKESDCDDGESGLYCEWIEKDEEENKAGKCAPKLDERSDVCCRGGAVKDACHSIAYKMECPKDWLVNKGCCPDLAERKYNKVLNGIPDDMDCCNSPCTQVEKAISNGTSNCSLSARCAPGPRSYAMTYDPYNTLGFYHDYRHHGVPHAFGSLIHGSGYDDHDGYEEDDYGYEEKDGGYDGHDDHKDGYNSHVDEITVDDLFELMIEALEDDTDVKSYDAEYYTDSYLGKTKSGGKLASLNLPDPDYYIDMLYGNPWGLNYNLDYEFSNPIPFYSSPYGFNDYYHNPSRYGSHHGPSYGAFDPYFNAYGGYGGALDNGYTSFPQAYQNQAQQYTNSAGGYGGALDNGYTSFPQAYQNQAQQYTNSAGGYEGALDNGYTSFPQASYQQPLQEQQYGNSPQPAYHNQAQQYGNSAGGYGSALDNGYTSFPQTYQQPLQEQRYGNSPQPAYQDQAQQYGNSPQPAYQNQQPGTSNIYGGVNQYSGQPKTQHQQSYQQQPPNANVQQAGPIQQTVAVNDHGHQHNQYPSPAARQNIIASQSYAAPAMYR